jgi:NAD-dependent SIR2 family protein deacetylase
MKKLLIIIGAGASLDFGMPSVTEIDKLFNSWASRHLPLANNERENLYTWVKDKVIKRLEEKSRMAIMKNRILNKHFLQFKI